MLSKCANPGCPASFLYLHEGKLFRLDSSTEILARIPVSEVTRPSRRFEFFWLCDQCAAELTLGYNNKESVLRSFPCLSGLPARRPCRRERPRSCGKLSPARCGQPPSAVQRSNAPLFSVNKNLSSLALPDSRGGCPQVSVRCSTSGTLAPTSRAYIRLLCFVFPAWRGIRG
jgi:hypothetical protein